MRAVKSSPFRFYNANVETLEYSTRCGGHGFSGISANFYPFLHSWLVKAIARADVDQKQIDLVQNFFTVAEVVVCINYPASAKKYLALNYDLPITTKCRKAEFKFGEQDELRLNSMAAMCRSVCKQVGIAEIDPVTAKPLPPVE